VCATSAGAGGEILLPVKTLLESIDVQTGSDLGEDDIVRIDDDSPRTRFAGPY
jgi:hypothetical protein